MKIHWLPLRLLAVGCALQALHVSGSISGNCEKDLSAYGATRFSRGTCQASLHRADVVVDLTGLVVKISANLTYKNEKTAIAAPVLTLPLPREAVLQGYQVQDMKGVVARSSSDDAAAIPCSNDMLSFYEFSGSGQSKQRVQLKRLKAEGEVQLHLEFLLLLQAKQKAEGKQVLDLPITFPALKRRSTLAEAVTLKIFGLSAMDAGLRTSTPGVVVQPLELETQRLMRHVVLRSTLQDLALEVVTEAPPLTDPLGFHLTLQRDPVSQRLAAALWMSPHSTLCGDEIYGERLEFVVLVDTSSTMRGSRRVRVKQAMRTVLRSLPQGVWVNFGGLGISGGEAGLFWSESRRLEKTSFEQIDAHLSTEADDGDFSDANDAPAAAGLGGLTSVLSTVFRGERRQLRVIIVTDRYPPDQKAAIQVIEDHCNVPNCRLFVAGLGWGASPLFVESAASAGHGGFSSVAERDLTFGLERNLISHMIDGCVPSVHDVQVQWDVFGGNISSATPIEVDFESGFRGRMISMAILGELLGECCRSPLTLEATVGGLRQRFQVASPEISEGSALHAMALHQLIEEEGEVSEELAAAYHLPLDPHLNWFTLETPRRRPLLCFSRTEKDEVPSSSDSSNLEQLSTREKSFSSNGADVTHSRCNQISQKLSALNFVTLSPRVSLHRGDRVGSNEGSKLKSWERAIDPYTRPERELPTGLSVRSFGKSERPPSFVDPIDPRDSRGVGSGASRSNVGSLDDLFFSGSHRSFPWASPVKDEKARDRKETSKSAAITLSTRQRPGGPAPPQSPRIPARLSALDMAKLGQRLSFHGHEEMGGGHKGQQARSPWSRLASLSIYDATLLGSSASLKPWASRKASSVSPPISTREKVVVTSSILWDRLTRIQDFQRLGSRLSLRSPSKLVREKVVSSTTGDKAKAKAVAVNMVAKTVEPEMEDYGWLGIRVAGGLVAGVAKVKFQHEKCMSQLETVQLQWANVSAAPAVLLWQGEVLGTVAPAVNNATLRVHVEVSSACTVTIRDDGQQTLLMAELPRSQRSGTCRVASTLPALLRQRRRAALRRGVPRLAAAARQSAAPEVVVAQQSFEGFFIFTEKSAVEAKLTWDHLQQLSRWCGSKETAHTCTALAALDKDSTWWPLTKRAKRWWLSNARSRCGTLGECIDLSILLVLQHWFPESHATRNGTCTLEMGSKRSKSQMGRD